MLNKRINTKVSSSLLNHIKKKFSKKPQMTSKEIVDKCKEYTLFSWSAQAKINPIPMVKAEGCYFWDADGKKYFDLNSQLMCSNVGHAHPKVIQAIKDQADELSYAGPTFATRARAEVGPLLAKRTPGDLNKFFFTNGGAEANENALKIAKFYTKRNKIMTRYRSYHGASLGAITLTGDPRRWPNEPALPGVLRTFDPYAYRSLLWEKGMSEEQFSEKCLKLLEEQLMYENPESFAAILIETVTGTNGILAPPKGYLQGLRKLCDKYGILLWCDEVMCGLGRTGEWFAVDHYNVVPDILTMAKGLTSAYFPLGCVAISPKIAHTFDNTVLSCGLTYQSHPMGMAVATSVLNVMEEEDLVGNSKRMGKVMTSLMQDLMKKHPSVGETRNIGLFGCFELVKSRETREPLAPYGGSSDACNKVVGYLRENGVFVFCGANILHTNPPLCVTEKQLRDVFAIVDKALDISDKYVL